MSAACGDGGATWSGLGVQLHALSRSSRLSARLRGTWLGLGSGLGVGSGVGLGLGLGLGLGAAARHVSGAAARAASAISSGAEGDGGGRGRFRRSGLRAEVGHRGAQGGHRPPKGLVRGRCIEGGMSGVTGNTTMEAHALPTPFLPP